MNMGELDQVFDNYSKKNRQYDKEEWIEYKKQEKQEGKKHTPVANLPTLPFAQKQTRFVFFHKIMF